MYVHNKIVYNDKCALLVHEFLKYYMSFYVQLNNTYLTKRGPISSSVVFTLNSTKRKKKKRTCPGIIRVLRTYLFGTRIYNAVINRPNANGLPKNITNGHFEHIDDY